MKHCFLLIISGFLMVHFLFFPKQVAAACGISGAATGGIYYVDGIDGIVGWAQNNNGSAVSCIDYYVVGRGEQIGPTTIRCASGSIAGGKTTSTLGTSNEAFPRMTAKNGHLFNHTTSCISALPDGEYDAYVAVAPNTFAPGPFEFSVRTIDSQQNRRVWGHYIGVGVSRGSSVYDSYPTIMKEGNLYKMWYASSVAGDSIFYATSPDGISWTLVNGPLLGGAVLQPTQNTCSCSDSGSGGSCPTGQSFAGDDMHTADPSVIKIGSTYYMYYTGASKRFTCFGSGSSIFMATSTDGINWQKHLGTDGKPQAVITPQVPCTSPANCGPTVYGAGQSTVLIKDITGDGTDEIIHYFTDTTTGMMAHSVATSPLGNGVNFTRYQNGVMGDLTWDTKYSDYFGRFISFNAIPTSPGVPGYILLAQSPDGTAGTWATVGTPLAGRNVLFTMDTFTADPNRWVVHNLGISGDPVGTITGRNTLLYFGSGQGMQPLEATWDIAGVDLWFTQDPPPSPTPTPSFTMSDLRTMLLGYLGNDTDWWDNDLKANILDATYIIRWLQ